MGYTIIIIILIITCLVDNSITIKKTAIVPQYKIPVKKHLHKYYIYW
jgi:hypothetical protein